MAELNLKTNAPVDDNGAFFVYIIKTGNNDLYIGQTDNLERREFEHKFHAHGAKFLKDSHTNFKLVYTEKFISRTEAMKREKQLKGWSRKKKQALISQDFSLLKKLAKGKKSEIDEG